MENTSELSTLPRQGSTWRTVPNTTVDMQALSYSLLWAMQHLDFLLERIASISGIAATNAAGYVYSRRTVRFLSLSRPPFQAVAEDSSACPVRIYKLSRPTLQADKSSCTA